DTDSTNNGVAQNLDWDKYSSLFMTLTYRTLSFQALSTSREKGIPTASYGTVFNDPSARTLDKRQMVELQWTPSLGSDKGFSVRSYFDRYYYEGTYPYDAPQYDGSSGVWVGTELQFHWDVATNNRITLGAEYQRHLEADYLLEYQGETLFSRDFPYNIKSLYVQDEYQPTENLSLTAGLRYDSYSTFGNTTNPRGAIIYNPAKGSTVKLLYGTAFRAPNIYEVYFEDPISGLKPNLNLKPETIQTAEIVWEQRVSDGLFGIVSLYDYRMKNLIETQIDETDSLTQFQNINRVNAQGFEFELNFRLAGNLRGYASYTAQKAQDATTEIELTNSPRHLVKGGISFPAFQLLDVGVELLYEGERTTVNNTQTDAFLLTNLNLRAQPFLDRLRFSVLVRNVFDAQYKLPGGLEHIQDAIPQPGRTVVVKAEVRL
ncbi:MAG TPA: TonB-dependent receptor, partial [Bacteroidota bacterium]